MHPITTRPSLPDPDFGLATAAPATTTVFRRWPARARTSAFERPAFRRGRNSACLRR